MKAVSQLGDGPKSRGQVISPKAALSAADHIVVIFPYLIGFMPTPLKAFVHQIMGLRSAFHSVKEMPQESFKSRSARVIVTMELPVPFYRFYSFGGADDLKRFKRDMLGVGIAPLHVNLFGMIKAADTRKWLTQMRELGVRAL